MATPSSISGLALWLRSDIGLFTDTAATTPVASDGDTVARWNDQSGNARDFSQSTAAQQPTWRTNVVHGRQVVRFDGSDDNLTGPDLSSLTAGELFMVVKVDNDPPAATGQSGSPLDFGTATLNNHFPFTDSNVYDGFGSTARKSVGNPTPSLASWRLWNVITTSSEWTANIDGTQIFTTATNTVGFDTTTRIGQGGTDPTIPYFDGDVAEIIVYNAKLSSGDRAIINSYVASLYNLTIVGAVFSASTYTSRPMRFFPRKF